MSDEYERIYLQQEADETFGRTWCKDRIYDDDTEYVRADLACYTVAELLARVEAMSNEDVCFVAVWHREIRSASDELLAADGRREFAAILREITRDGP